MELGLAGKTAIVCGASRGLGKACAETLASEKVNLVICSRNFDSIFDTARSISETYGVDVAPIAADISHPESPDKLVRKAVSRFGGIDILVNNAGGPPAGHASDFTDDNWDAAYQLTLMSVVRMSQAVIPVMKNNAWGRIINLASISVKQPIAGLMLSNSLRSAVVGYAKTLADEVAGSGILVNTIATGTFETERLQSIIEHRAARSEQSTAELRKSMENAIPLGRIGKPEELSWLVAFLASDRASFITGNTIQIDGGSYRGMI